MLSAAAWRFVQAPFILCHAHADADTALGEQQGKPEPITAAMSCMDALFNLCQVSYSLLTGAMMSLIGCTPGSPVLLVLACR